MISTAKLKVAVLKGGKSAEAEVSRTSAAQVSEALEHNHSVTQIEIDADLVPNLVALQPDVVFPALHGPPGEDGTVQGLLEMLGLAYVGSDVRSSAFAMDKHIAKLVFSDAGLPIARDLLVRQDEADQVDAAAQRVRQSLGEQVVVKPMNQGSAIGVTPMPKGGDVAAALRTALTFGDALVEQFVTGAEVTVGVLDHGDRVELHPPIEVRTASDHWYDYENRYKAGASEHLVPAPLADDTLARLQDIAGQAHALLGLRDLSRSDFIVTHAGEIILLEVNTLPGMTPTSLYPDGAKALGYSFEELMLTLVNLAAQRR